MLQSSRLEYHMNTIGIDRKAFKRRELFQDVICRLDYDERVVASFDNQIRLEYYGGNISVSIEGIALENFSAVP